MARATFINAILSGKLDGTVYARNKGGAYVRNWVKPTNPKTSVQQGVRSGFTDASKYWSSLTNATKKAWNYYATSYFKPKRKKSGVVYSGFNAFQSLQNTQIQAARNYRAATLEGPWTDITRSSMIVNDHLPIDIFQGQPVDPNGINIPFRFTYAELKVDGELTISFETNNEFDPQDLRFIGLTDDRKIGYLAYGNIPNTSTPTENICIGFSGFIESSESVALPRTGFGMKFPASTFNMADRKLWYQAGQKAIITVYAVSNYGEMALMGNYETIVAEV